MTERAWKLDLNAASHETATAAQHLRQLLHASVELSDLARRSEAGVLKVLKEIETARNKGAVKAPEVTTREVLTAGSDVLPKTMGEREQLAEFGGRLLETFDRVSGNVELHRWLQTRMTHARRGFKHSPMSEPGVRVSGAVFAPLNGDDPKENGEALTLRVITEQGALPDYFNLGTIISLAMIGAQVTRLMMGHPRPEDLDDDEMMDGDDDRGGYDRD